MLLVVMKRLAKQIISILNKGYLLFLPSSVNLMGNLFYFLKMNINKHSEIKLFKSNFEKSKFNVTGHSNLININKALVCDSLITINGNNNELVLSPGVKLRKARIIIRGNNCTITIGKNTSFGEIRIVNVGNNCDIAIGEDCLFADNIEMWSSDTHPIYNSENEIINPEQSITIGNNVWVGSHVTILKGVTVHTGSVIGMGSMVTKDIPARVISVGRPSRTIKEDISWSLDYKEES